MQIQGKHFIAQPLLPNSFSDTANYDTQVHILHKVQAQKETLISVLDTLMMGTL